MEYILSPDLPATWYQDQWIGMVSSLVFRSVKYRCCIVLSIDRGTQFLYFFFSVPAKIA